MLQVPDVADSTSEMKEGMEDAVKNYELRELRALRASTALLQQRFSSPRRR